MANIRKCKFCVLRNRDKTVPYFHDSYTIFNDRTEYIYAKRGNKLLIVCKMLTFCHEYSRINVTNFRNFEHEISPKTLLSDLFRNYLRSNSKEIQSNNDMCNCKTANCPLNSFPEGKFVQLITNCDFLHFSLICTIKVVWKELLIEWKLMTRAKISDERLFNFSRDPQKHEKSLETPLEGQ